jgi:hypothetical protein
MEAHAGRFGVISKISYVRTRGVHTYLDSDFRIVVIYIHYFVTYTEIVLNFACWSNCVWPNVFEICGNRFRPKSHVRHAFFSFARRFGRDKVAKPACKIQNSELGNAILNAITLR